MFSHQIHQLESLNREHDQLLDVLGVLLRTSKNFRDINRERPFQELTVGERPYTVSEVIIYAERAIKSFRSIKFLRGSLVPPSHFSGLVNQTQIMQNIVGELWQPFDVVGSIGSELSHISGSRLVNSNGDVTVDITDIINRLVVETDAFLTHLSAVAAFAKISSNLTDDPTRHQVHDDVGATMEALKSAELAAGEAAGFADELQATVTRAQAVKTELEDQLSRASETTALELGKLEAALNSASESVSKATADAAVAASKREEMDRLTAQAQEAYKALSSFQATLRTTQKGVSDVEARAAHVTTQLEDQREAVGKLILQAERMVSGSTVAGLAKAFDDERKLLDKSMKGAFKGFIAGIILLFITSGALAAYILNIPIEGLEWLTKRGTADPTLAQVLSRSVIVIAPFWLTLFSARRYRSLFDLRQQYSHKYNMAFSMDGFKTQAPSFAESIAAWVFTIVATNPVLPKSGAAMDTAPPLTVQGMIRDAQSAYDKVMRRE